MPEQPDPQYRLSVFLDDTALEFDKPIEDPFVTSTVVIGEEDVAVASAEGRGITVRVQVGGTRAALAHVFRKPMDLTPNEDLPASSTAAAEALQ